MKDVREMMQNYDAQTEKTGSFSKDELNAKSGCDDCLNICFCAAVWSDCCCSCVS